MDVLTALLANFTLFTSLLFIVGVVLLGIEMFIPGFGVFGILGVICLGVDVFMTAKTLPQVALMLAFIIAIVGIMILIMLILASYGKLPKSLVLKANEEKVSQSTKDDAPLFLLGSDGLTTTKLRPAGKMDKDGRSYDVVSDGEFIDVGIAVTVVSVDGNKITVKKK